MLSTLPVVLTVRRSAGCPGVGQEEVALGSRVGVGGSAVVDETDAPAEEGVAVGFCKRAAQEPGADGVRVGVVYVGPCLHPRRAVAVGGVALASGSRRLRC